jgi:hypothetical protein
LERTVFLNLMIAEHLALFETCWLAEVNKLQAQVAEPSELKTWVLKLNESEEENEI